MPSKLLPEATVRNLAYAAVTQCTTNRQRGTRREPSYRRDVRAHGPMCFTTYIRAWWDACLDTEFGGSPFLVAVRVHDGRATRADLLASLGMTEADAAALAAG